MKYRIYRWLNRVIGTRLPVSEYEGMVMGLRPLMWVRAREDGTLEDGNRLSWWRRWRGKY